MLYLLFILFQQPFGININLKNFLFDCQYNPQLDLFKTVENEELKKEISELKIRDKFNEEEKEKRAEQKQVILIKVFQLKYFLI